MLRTVLLALLLSLLGGLTMTAQAATKIKGIDVSRWQGTINWKQVKADGVKFAMIGMGRVHGDRLDLDPQFENNIKGTNQNGIAAGIYLYSLATTEKQAIREANLILDAIEGYTVSYPVAIDLEDQVQRGLSNARRTDIALAFMKTIKEAGYYPMLYASESWLQHSMDYSRMKAYDMWVARWSSGMTFSPVAIWQHSSTGRVKGINGLVDLDISYKDYTKLITPRTKADNADQRSGWQTKGTKTYYLKTCGDKVTGWKKIDGKWYYFNGKGVLQKGWFTYKGKSCYTNAKTGARKTGWVKKGKYTYFVKNSRVQTGWLKRSGKTYYLTSKGRLVTGRKKIKGKWYEFDKETGALIEKK